MPKIVNKTPKLNENSLVVIFGGSGFLGKNIINHLVKTKARIRIVSRHGETAKSKEIKVCGAVGQIAFVKGDVKYYDDVVSAVQGATHVVNLVGLLHQHTNNTFQKAHVDGASNIANACKGSDIRLVHVSAMGIERARTSEYAKTKLFAENEFQSLYHSAVIIRPNVMFGRDDNFINMFAKFIKYLPIFPVVCGDSKIQPVYVDDVAKAILNALEMKPNKVQGKIFEIAGPNQYSMRTIIKWICKVMGKRIMLVNIPLWFAKIEAFFLEMLPFEPLITRDNLEMLKHDCIISQKHKNDYLILGLEDLCSVEQIVPPYLNPDYSNLEK